MDPRGPTDSPGFTCIISRALEVQKTSWGKSICIINSADHVVRKKEARLPIRQRAKIPKYLFGIRRQTFEQEESHHAGNTIHKQQCKVE